MKQKNKKLSIRIMKYCIVFGVVLSSMIGGLGIHTYNQNSLEHYNKYVSMVMKLALDTIDTEDMEKCIRTKEESDIYYETIRQLDQIKENTEIVYLYIIAPVEGNDRDSVMYVLNALTVEERKIEEERRDKLGKIAYINNTKDGFPKKLMERFHESMYGDEDETANGYSDNGDVSSSVDPEKLKMEDNQSDYGRMRTYIYPIKNSENKNIAILCANLSIDEINHDRMSHVYKVIGSTVVILSVFLFLFIWRINNIIVKPIIGLSNNTMDFVEQTKNETEPEKMEFKKLDIHSGDEIEILSDSLNEMTKDTIEYMGNIESITADKERFAAELDVAKLIQSSMIPCIFPAFPERSDFDIFALIKAAKTVGGDFYDFFLLDETHLCMVIADVSGHGIPAALFMIVARTLIKNYGQMGLPAHKIFMETNDRLCENNETNMSITAFLGILDLHNGKFTYVNADHQPPLIKRAGGNFEQLPVKRGFVLAGLEKVPYYSQEVTLMQGDMLFMLTEGIIKVKNGAGEPYSEERLKEFLNQAVHSEYDLEQLLLMVNKDLEQHRNGEEMSEDITMMMFRYLGV